MKKISFFILFFLILNCIIVLSKQKSISYCFYSNDSALAYQIGCIMMKNINPNSIYLYCNLKDFNDSLWEFSNNTTKIIFSKINYQIYSSSTSIKILDKADALDIANLLLNKWGIYSTLPILEAELEGNYWKITKLLKNKSRNFKGGGVLIKIDKNNYRIIEVKFSK
jgi:hypothetical protein